MNMTAPSLPSPSSPPGVDIFCRVIDNYGDIGVCWRLARQLAARHDQPVRLWVDDMGSFARLAAQLQPEGPFPQHLHGVAIHPWEAADLDDIQPLHAVIEAFACDLPPRYLSRLQAGRHAWINLEYLSAEDWVQDCHGLPSLQSNGVSKRFFFPGFTLRTGGLLREPQLIAQRQQWQADASQRILLLKSLGVPANAIQGLIEQGWQQIYAFCYPHAPLQSLLQAWQAQTSAPTVLLAAPGAPAVNSVDATRLLRVDCPFVDQDGFDRLLWGSDLNLVRGEDSFVRAIWAGRPFLWHIYPQQEDAHLAKLQAWLALGPCPAADAMQLAWNTSADDAATHPVTPTWAFSVDNRAAWQQQAAAFSDAQAALPDLVQQLIAALA